MQEGTVCIYNDEMQLYKTYKAITESCKVRDLWITDFVLMANGNKVAIAYTSKELSTKSFTITNYYFIFVKKLFMI